MHSFRFASLIATLTMSLTSLACDPLDQAPTAVEPFRDEGVPPNCPTPDPEQEAGAPVDPGAPGPYAAWFITYDISDDGFHPPSLLPTQVPVEERATVFFPDPLDCGPFPVVLIMHGGHDTCYDPQSGNTEMEWPCSPAHPNAYPSYRGYDSLGLALARHGIVAVSISANGVNAGGDDVARAELYQHHLDLLREMNTSVDPYLFGLLQGHLDLDRVGTLGHSRGGAGAMEHGKLNADLGSPYGLLATFLLAPAQTNTLLPPDIATAALVPYCDGDQEDLYGLEMFDKALYDSPTDSAPRYTAEMMGANHNFFNTTWDPSQWPFLGTDDVYFGMDEICTLGTADWPRLSGADQRATLQSTVLTFFRAYLDGRTDFLPYLKGDSAPPPSSASDQIFYGYHPPAPDAHRRVINRLEEVGDGAVNDLGGNVESLGSIATTMCEFWVQSTSGCLTDIGSNAGGRAPHASTFGNKLGQLRIEWDDTGSTPTWINHIPGGWKGDFSGYRTLQFRAFVDFQNANNPAGKDRDFRVELVDKNGASASVIAGDHTRALFFPPSVADPHAGGTPTFPHAVFNSVRIPLSAFAGVDLTAVREVRLIFDRSETGAINVSDLLLADPS